MLRSNAGGVFAEWRFFLRKICAILFLRTFEHKAEQVLRNITQQVTPIFAQQVTPIFAQEA